MKTGGFFSVLIEQEGIAQQDHQACNVCRGEDAHELHDIGIGPAHIKLQGNEAGQRGDGGAQTADVDTCQHLLPMIGETGQKHSGGDIADDLAGTHCGEQRILAQKHLEEITDGIHTAQVFGNHEEAHEGDQQHEVNFLQQFPVDDQECGYDDDGGYNVIDDAENRQQAQNKQANEDQQFLETADACFFQILLGQCLGQGREGGSGERNQANCGEGNGDREEITGAHGISCIKVQVLGIANGRGHTAQVCSDGLKHNDGNDVLGASQISQQRQRKGNEYQQSHVIGDQHGAEEGQQHQRCTEDSAAVDPVEQLISQPLEGTNALKTGDHCHQAKQQAQNPEVDVMDVFHVRGNQEHGQHGASCCDAEDRFFCYEVFYLCKHSNTLQ